MAQVERNVVYGMYSGLALLMDAYRPEQPNGYGIVYTNGSAWHRPLAYNADALKDAPAGERWIGVLVDAGYTVFAINHRAAPRFKYPAAVLDAQRAVRFVRYYGEERWGIRTDRIGACGGSSGGHLTLMLGLLLGARETDDPDPVNRVSAHVQCVVARAPITSTLHMTNVPFVADFMGMLANLDMPGDTPERVAYANASPVTHVSHSSAPALLLHGTADTVVPFSQSERMLAAYEDEKVPAKLVPIAGAGHAADFPGATEPVPDYLGETVAWFERYLQHDWLTENELKTPAAGQRRPGPELVDALNDKAPGL